MEEDEYLFELNKFHRTTPAARYDSRPIRLEVNIQKSVPTFTSGNTEQDCTIIASNFTIVKDGLLEPQLRIANIIILFYSAKCF